MSQLKERIAQLERELQFQKERMAAVEEIGRALGSTLKTEPLLALIMEKITELMNAERSTLFLIDEDNNQLWSRIAQGGITKEIRIDIGQGIAGHVAKTGESINIKDAYKDNRFNQDVDKETGYRTRSILCVPMRNHRREIIGVVQTLNRKDGYFTTDDEALLAALGSQAALWLENSKLYVSVVGKNIELRHAHDQIQARMKEIDLLFRLEQELNRAFGLEPFLLRLLAETTQAVPSFGAAILLREAKGFRFLVRVEDASRGPIPVAVFGEEHTGVPVEVANSGEDYVDNNIEDGAAYHAAMAEALGPDAPIRRALCVPLELDGERFGSIQLVDRRSSNRARYGDADIKILTLIAGRVESALVLSNQRDEELNANRLAAIGQALSGVLHDLKTPMTIIGGYAQLMVDEPEEEERKAFSDTISRQLSLLKRMTEEILQFARGEASLLVRKVFLHTFMPHLEEGLKQEFSGRNVNLTVQMDYVDAIRMDIGKMERVFFNLARNSRQAMPAGGDFTIRTSLSEADDMVTFEFEDNGPGIPEAIRGRLFESFVTSGKKDGTGLGLAIVKKIVELHKGSIDFTSETGEGTTFRVRLPRNLKK